jgi:hypothetical protein
VRGIPSATNGASASYRDYAQLTQALAAADAQQPSTLPKVGIIGNPALVYTPELNRQLLEQVRNLGCKPVTLPITLATLTNAPLLQGMDWLLERGVRDIVVLQSFGCLTGHINGRGAMHAVKERHPNVNVTFIDYDSGSSQINQQNRLELALTIAKEHS